MFRRRKRARQDLGGWLNSRHPEIVNDLFMGIPDQDSDRADALRSESAMEAWLRRHHPRVHEEWKASSGAMK